jgi:uncharacterized protein
MKYSILLMIRLYWFFKPKNSKPKCIFRTSCSHYVYEITQKQGFLKGLKSLLFRFRNCRYGFEIFENPITKNVEMLLPNKTVIDSNGIAKRLIN